jgi:hypothetical protein
MMILLTGFYVKVSQWKKAAWLWALGSKGKRLTFPARSEHINPEPSKVSTRLNVPRLLAPLLIWPKWLERFFWKML